MDVRQTFKDKPLFLWLSCSLVSALCLLVLVFAGVPVSAAVIPSGQGDTVGSVPGISDTDAGNALILLLRIFNHEDITAQQPNIPGRSDTHARSGDSTPPGTTRLANPTPAPTRLPRNPVLPEATKKPVERPVVAVPVFWLIIIFFLAGAGLVALLYLLIRQKPTLGGGKGPAPEPRSRHATILEQPVHERSARAGDPASKNSVVRLPALLEKKYPGAEFVGEGGLARVFRAKNIQTGRTVAVKIPIRFDEVTGTHFTKDILLWKGLFHKNIVKIYDVNVLPVPYLEMEYVGSSLARLQFPVAEAKALKIITGVTEGVSYAHAQGIVHRDIKPDNILIADDGTPKIADWGLAKAIADAKQSGIIGFSLSYAAPEQVAPNIYGKAGPWTDIYQIGVILYEMLTGTVPYSGDDLAKVSHAILYDKTPQPLWPGHNVQEIRKIIMKCLEKDPHNRYGSAAELLADLRALP